MKDVGNSMVPWQVFFSDALADVHSNGFPMILQKKKKLFYSFTGSHMDPTNGNSFIPETSSWNFGQRTTQIIESQIPGIIDHLKHHIIERKKEK